MHRVFKLTVTYQYVNLLHVLAAFPDVDTRRRAACDLVRALSRYFEQKMTEVFSQYVQLMLGNYAKDPANKWMAKDAAIYLVTSLAAKAQTTKVNFFKAKVIIAF